MSQAELQDQKAFENISPEQALVCSKPQARFINPKKLGEGSFSIIYEAHDTLLKQNVALKVEKPDKSKAVLKMEYEVLQSLQGLAHICKVYDFVENCSEFYNLNAIVMELQGPNLSVIKKTCKREFTPITALEILIQMLHAIKAVHKKGYLHRDIKPSNFVIGAGLNKGLIFIVDFGLVKKHLSQEGLPKEERKFAEFRGTVPYASINAHNNHDLGRRDDLWSFYFVILEFLNETLPWKINLPRNEIKDLKEQWIGGDIRWRVRNKDVSQLKNIFQHLKSLEYSSTPDYDFILRELEDLRRITREEEGIAHLSVIGESNKSSLISQLLDFYDHQVKIFESSYRCKKKSYYKQGAGGPLPIQNQALETKVNPSTGLSSRMQFQSGQVFGGMWANQMPPQFAAPSQMTGGTPTHTMQQYLGNS